jgi:hypothetical protein
MSAAAPVAAAAVAADVPAGSTPHHCRRCRRCRCCCYIYCRWCSPLLPPADSSRGNSSSSSEDACCKDHHFWGGQAGRQGRQQQHRSSRGITRTSGSAALHREAPAITLVTAPTARLA